MGFKRIYSLVEEIQFTLRGWLSVLALIFLEMTWRMIIFLKMKARSIFSHKNSAQRRYFSLILPLFAATGAIGLGHTIYDPSAVTNALAGVGVSFENDLVLREWVFHLKAEIGSAADTILGRNGHFDLLVRDLAKRP